MNVSDMNDFQKLVEVEVEMGNPIVRLCGERGCGKTKYLIDRAIELAKLGFVVLYLEGAGSSKGVRMETVRELQDRGIRNALNWESKNIVELPDHNGKIVFTTGADFARDTKGRKFQEILVDNDQRITEYDWDIIKDEAVNLGNRIISLSS